MVKKKLLYVAQIDNFISFSEVSLNILNALKRRISNEYEIFIFIINKIDMDGSNRKRVSEYTNIPINNIFIINDRIKISDNFHDLKFIDYYVKGYKDINPLTLTLNPDLIFLLGDTWLVNSLIKQLNRIQHKWKGRIVPYIPIDISNLREELIDAKYDFIIAATKFSQNDIRKIKKNTNVYYLPHIIHKKFKKLQNIEELKIKYLGEENKDKFIIGAFNANSIRKRWDIILESFCRFNNIHRNSFLMLKTSRLNYRPNNSHSSGFILEKLINDTFTRFNVSKDNIKIITDRVDLDTLNEMYNCVDIFINSTDGEGFGLIPFEVAQLNKVTIMPNYSSFSTFFDDKKYNFMTDVKVYPSSLIRDYDNITNILTGNQYFCVYKSSESNIKQKVSFENNLLYVSPIIKTIIVSNNGSDNMKIDYNPINNVNLFYHTKTLEKALNILKTIPSLPEQFQILISSDLNILHETYVTLKKFHYDVKNKKEYRSVMATNPKILKDYSIIEGFHIGLTNSNYIIEKLLFYFNNRHLLEEDGKIISELVSKNLNEKVVMDKLFKIFRNENIELEKKIKDI